MLIVSIGGSIRLEFGLGLQILTSRVTSHHLHRLNAKYKPHTEGSGDKKDPRNAAGQWKKQFFHGLNAYHVRSGCYGSSQG